MIPIVIFIVSLLKIGPHVDFTHKYTNFLVFNLRMPS
jgi:hypothetical protein